MTPEATRVVIEREAHGIAERCAPSPFARFRARRCRSGVAGVRGIGRSSSIFPAPPSGVSDTLAALEPIVDHAVDIVRGSADRSRPHDAAAR